MRGGFSSWCCVFCVWFFGACCFLGAYPSYADNEPNPLLSATIQIQTTPTGLPVAINGSVVGKSPIKQQMDPGIHKVLVNDPCFEPEGAVVSVRAGEMRQITLEPRVQRVPVALDVQIVSSVVGNGWAKTSLEALDTLIDDSTRASVWADGVRQAWLVGTGLQEVQVPRCVRMLEVRAPGGLWWRSPVDLHASDLAAFTVRLSHSKVLDDLQTNGLKVGMRVSRGPSWRWGEQGRGLPGTVVEPPDADGWVMILWDSGERNNYRYLPSGEHDVEASLEVMPPSILPSIFLALRDPTSNHWDNHIRTLLLSSFDRDNSGWLDTKTEISAVDCNVWNSLDKAVRRGGRYSDVIGPYGLAPNLTWLGGLWGFSTQSREQIYEQINTCLLKPVEIEQNITVGMRIEKKKGEGKQRGTVIKDENAEGFVVVLWDDNRKEKFVWRSSGEVQVLDGPEAKLTAEHVASAIVALEQAGSSAWDQTASQLLLRAFDRDGSGLIDQREELSKIPCEVYAALDAALRTTAPQAGLAGLYGFIDGLAWVGGALGISQRLRDDAVRAVNGCGLLPIIE